MSEGIVKIHGKDYKTVAYRIKEFREAEEYKNWRISTEILSIDSENVVIRASILCDIPAEVIATGIAHEVKGSSNINNTSHIENCETSAIGRALACLGLAGTDSYASADEVVNAISNQKIKEATDKLLTHNKLLAMNIHTVSSIKSGIASNALSEAAEAWFELDKDTMTGLWLAPSKGGAFTTREIEIMKSSEFRKAHFGEDV